MTSTNFQFIEPRGPKLRSPIPAQKYPHLQQVTPDNQLSRQLSRTHQTTCRLFRRIDGRALVANASLAQAFRINYVGQWVPWRYLIVSTW